MATVIKKISARFRKTPQLAFNFGEITVDNFAGGGGASTGIESAIGRPVDIAINHDQAAIAMHEVNHPGTMHYCESVWDVDPRKVCAGRPVGLAWFSPDCKHFSKAKGGKPVEKKIRGLAWVVLRWAATVRPRVIMLENVEEFLTWGPLVKNDEGELRPCPKSKGRTFNSFVNALRRQGYVVDWKIMRACDYGAPTIRKRLFLVARCDGQEIVWPEPTHGDPNIEAVKSGRLLPWRTASECIDWSIPCPSIFERKRQLAEATMRRIAKGIMRYVVDNPDPFIVTYYGSKGPDFRGQSIADPLKTQTTENRHALITPIIANTANSKTTGRGPNVWDSTEPLRTITSAPGLALIVPYLTEHANASSQRNMPANEPLRTQCAQVKGGHFALCSAFLAKHYGGVVGSQLVKAIGTITSVDHHSLVSAHLVRQFGKSVGSAAGEPVGTITAGGGGKTMLATSHLVKLRGTCKDGQSANKPAPTVTAGGTHIGEVRAFLIKYFGTDQDPKLREPLHTITTKDRFGLVTVRGVEYQIVDIGMRMLSPRELFRAQGFPADYIIDRDTDGKRVTKTEQVAKCGNSVCPPIAEALVRVNMVAIAPQIKHNRRGAACAE